MRSVLSPAYCPLRQLSDISHRLWIWSHTVDVKRKNRNWRNATSQIEIYMGWFSVGRGYYWVTYAPFSFKNSHFLYLMTHGRQLCPLGLCDSIVVSLMRQITIDFISWILRYLTIDAISNSPLKLLFPLLSSWFRTHFYSVLLLWFFPVRKTGNDVVISWMISSVTPPHASLTATLSHYPDKKSWSYLPIVFSAVGVFMITLVIIN